jgi:hypothetical protein
MADSVQFASASEQAAAGGLRLLGRDRLARLVVVGSFLTLFLLVGTLLALAQQRADKELSDVATNAFNAILPVLAGWVGTVLAFYFSAASQERTSASLDKAISQTGGTVGTGALVSEKMIPLASILELQDLTGRKPEDIKLANLQVLYKKDQSGGGKVTRLIFIEKNVFRYIVHESALNAFILSKTAASAIGEGQSPAKVENLTFANMLADPQTLHDISKLVVFVSAAATVGEAQTTLNSVSGAHDVIVTGSGNASAPMIGWLSNVDLTKALAAN